MDIMPIFAGIVGLCIVVAVVSALVSVSGAIAGLYASDDEA